MKLRNILAALRDQLPPKRFFINFFVTGNAWGLFHKHSHVSQGTGKPKVKYPKRDSALKAATAMERKRGYHYSIYRCAWCDGYHIGRNRTSIKKKEEDNARDISRRSTGISEGESHATER